MKYKQFFLLSAVLCAGCAPHTASKAPVALTWQDNGYDAESKLYTNTFVIRNSSDKPLTGGWYITYYQFPRHITQLDTTAIRIERVEASYYRLSPATGYQAIAPGDSLIVRYRVSSRTPNISRTPQTCRWVSTASRDTLDFPVELKRYPPTDAERMQSLSAQKVYEENEAIRPTVASNEGDLLPMVKECTLDQAKSFTIPAAVSMEYSNENAREARFLQEALLTRHNIRTEEGATATIRLDLYDAPNTEQYKLIIGEQQIELYGATPHAVFNGIQTLLALLRGQDVNGKLACRTITDYPDMHYRGMMLDIARNFTPVDSLKRLIGVLASYKINVLHFHFSDDEAWALEIPGLPELTEFSTWRKNSHYTRAEFIDLLRFAALHHIRIIPEIESPGHARAAIHAMQARYRNYIATDARLAGEYLLSEQQDTSRYSSAQDYTDNVMNVALPSTYRFMEKVISELQAMYAEAGEQLEVLHIGGDEVPNGAWTGSPACKQLMQQEGMTEANQLFAYYYRRMSSYLQEQGIRFSGWQEVALHNDAATDDMLRSRMAGVYCWQTVGDSELPYRVAANGYPVVLCNVEHFYLDMQYTPHYDEPGHSWGGYVDEKASFSIRLKQGEQMRNIIGMQCELFSETIRNYAMVEYYTFPKLLGMVERSWNNRSPLTLSHFYGVLSGEELPALARAGINFRLPGPGLCIKEGKLYVNSPLPKAVIRYTTDGSEPTPQSPRWKEPLACDAPVVKARLFYLGKESVTMILFHQPNQKQ
jgi:hexosaminidase